MALAQGGDHTDQDDSGNSGNRDNNDNNDNNDNSNNSNNSERTAPGRPGGPRLRLEASSSELELLPRSEGPLTTRTAAADVPA